MVRGPLSLLRESSGGQAVPFFKHSDQQLAVGPTEFVHEGRGRSVKCGVRPKSRSGASARQREQAARSKVLPTSEPERRGSFHVFQNYDPNMRTLFPEEDDMRKGCQ